MISSLEFPRQNNVMATQRAPQRRRLVLASTSPYRKELLGRLGLVFETVAPHTDERPLAGESPQDTSLRLAALKAQAVRAAHRDALIIGSDQVATSVQTRVVPCRVHFRTLDDLRIENYLQREKPYDCAGSAKAEGLGIALIARIETEDPTSLIGLPLIALTEMLEHAGLAVV
jgi:septum formation protein